VGLNRTIGWGSEARILSRNFTAHTQYCDVAVLRPEGVIGWVQIAVKVFWENSVLHRSKVGRSLPTKKVRALNYMKATRMTMHLKSADEIELDGGSFGKAIALKARIKPAGLLVRVPQSEAVPGA